MRLPTDDNYRPMYHDEIPLDHMGDLEPEYAMDGYSDHGGRMYADNNMMA